MANGDKPAVADLSDRLLAMSERVQEMQTTQWDHLAIAKGTSEKVDGIVAELPRLRWAAYGSLFISLATAVFVAWLVSQVLTVHVDGPAVHLPR